MTELDKPISGQELADWLGVPHRTVEHWRYQGTGPKHFKVGKRVRYRVEDVRAWIEAQCNAEAV